MKWGLRKVEQSTKTKKVLERERKKGSWVGEELLRKAIRVDKRTESKKGSRESLLYTSLRRP